MESTPECLMEVFAHRKQELTRVASSEMGIWPIGTERTLAALWTTAQYLIPGEGTLEQLLAGLIATLSKATFGPQ